MINMPKAYKIRLCPNQKQATLIDKTIGACRFVYNQMLAERKAIFEQLKTDKEGIKTYQYKTEKECKEEFVWLTEVSSRALQQSRINLETAYKNFFRELKKCKIAFPKFKSKHKSRLSYREPQVSNSIEITGNKIKLLKLGRVKFRGLAKSFTSQNKILSATISKNPDGKYYCSVLVENQPTKKAQLSSEVIGADLGLKDFLITSKGQYFTPIQTKKIDLQIRFWQKKLARQQKSSIRRYKTKLKIASLHQKATNIKNHFHWHLANKLCSENQAISLESLQVKNMIKNRKLSRSIHQISWSGFLKKLSQKAEEYNTKLHFQDRFYASTKTCYICDFKNKNITLQDRTLVCPKCQFSIQRDLQSALNLEKQISLEYSDYRHREIVRPAQVNFDLAGKFVEVSTKEIVNVNICQWN
jgi:putative transposase